LRYDNTKVGGDFVSPSLGLTWLATKDLLFRANASRGFNDPRLTDANDSPGFKGNDDIKPENIWAYQVGAETNILDILRAKVTLFHHDIDDILSDDDVCQGDNEQEQTCLLTRTNAGEARNTGGELNISTKEYKGFTFKGGFHYERMKLLNFTSDRSFDVTKSYSFNTSITYKGQGLRAILQGHYMWWNLPQYWDAKYDGFIVDFNVIKDILKTKSTTLEVFLTGHNILNEASYNDSWSKNPEQWFEGGIRYRF